MKHGINSDLKLTYHMGRNLKVLRWKMVISHLYLVFIALTIAALCGCFDLTGKGITPDKEVGAANILKIFLILALLINWGYSALYYPLFYRSYILEIGRKKFTNDYPKTDLSNGRGYLAAAISIPIFIINYQGLTSIIVMAVWASLLMALSYFSKTKNLFLDCSIRVNRIIIIETILGNNPVEKRANKYRDLTYEEIGYLQPIKEKDPSYAKDIITALYCQHVIDDYNNTLAWEERAKAENKQADAISQKIAKEQKPKITKDT